MRARWRPLPCTCLHYSPKVRSRRSAPPQACYRCCSTPHTCRYTVLARAYPLVALRPIPYNVSFATLLPIGYFSPSLEHLKSQNEPHRRVELAKTSSKSLFLRHLANQRLRYGPRRHFLFWLHVPVLFSQDCCYLPEARCPAHASRATHPLLRLPPNVASPCFGPCLPVGSAHAGPVNFPYNVRFAQLLPIGGFHGTPKHPRSRQETHRCVALVTTSPTCFETLHLDHHLLGYGPRP